METPPSLQWEYQTLAVKIQSGGGGFMLDTFRIRATAIQADCFALLQRLGLQGWELVSVVPVTTTGKGSTFVRTEYAICFLKRPRTRSVPAPIQVAPPKATVACGEPDPAMSVPLSVAEMKSWVRRQYVIDSSKAGRLRLDDEMWDFLCRNSVHEAVNTVVQKIRACVDSLDDHTRKVLTQCETYFGSLPAEYSMQPLYNLFLEPKTTAFAFDAIVRLDLFDFDRVNTLLLSENFEHRKKALRLFKAHKDSYTQDDIPGFQRCLGTIDDAFKKRGKEVGANGMLSAKAKAMWECEDGHKNDIGTHYCEHQITGGVCGKDIFGFRQDEFKPEAAKLLISRKMEVLRVRFNEKRIQE